LAQTTTFLDELKGAAQGCFALLTGNRQAADYFDFSQRGLIGSLIAFVIASTVTAFLPQVLGFGGAPGTATRALVLGAAMFGLQVGIAWLVLRQLGRPDGFVPFLVADNWATFFTSFLSMILLFTGGTSDIAFIVIGLVVLIVEINIARRIVTLSGMQVAIFIIAQLVASSIGLLLLMLIMGPSALPSPV